MTIVYLVIVIGALTMLFTVLILALMAAQPRETLDEQAAWIRRNREEREAKQQAREAKRRRKTI